MRYEKWGAPIIIILLIISFFLLVFSTKTPYERFHSCIDDYPDALVVDGHWPAWSEERIVVYCCLNNGGVPWTDGKGVACNFENKGD